MTKMKITQAKQLRLMGKLMSYLPRLKKLLYHQSEDIDRDQDAPKSKPDQELVGVQNAQHLTGVNSLKGQVEASMRRKITIEATDKERMEKITNVRDRESRRKTVWQAAIKTSSQIQRETSNSQCSATK